MEGKLLAIVGMSGAGKSEVIHILQEYGIPFIRFGKQTEIGLTEKNLPVTPENEQAYREEIRQKLGMAAYAIKAKGDIDQLLNKESVVAIDGLYSWEEYVFLKEHFPTLLVIAVIAPAPMRYERLKARKVRPFTYEEARKRDISEIENIHKAGPIAIADYYLENTGTKKQLEEKTQALLQQLGILKA